MAHGQHAQASQLLRGVEHHRGEPARHLGVEANLDPSLDLVLTFHQEVQQFLRVHNSFSKVCHQSNQCSVPLVDNL